MNKKKIAIIGGAITALVAIVATTLYFALGPTGGVSPEAKTNYQSDSESGGKDEGVGKTDRLGAGDLGTEWYERSRTRYPVNYQSWQKTPYEGKIPKELERHYEKNGLGDDSLPSLSAGYTSDTKKALGKDGLPNPLYSFWTKEEFSRQVGHYIEMIVNPDYGFATPGQHGDRIDIDNISEWFTPKMREEALSNPSGSWYPFLFSDKGDAFGFGTNRLPAQSSSVAPIFYGEATDIKTTFDYNDEKEQYTARVTFVAKYSAFDKNKSVAQMKQKVSMVITPGEESGGSRYLIDSIEVGGISR